MAKLHWSEVAEVDLDHIYDYIARDVPYYAEMFVDRLIEATDKLEDHPRMGRKVPEADDRDDVRELIVQGYRIITCYKPTNCKSSQCYTAAVIWRGRRKNRGRKDRPYKTKPRDSARNLSLFVGQLVRHELLQHAA